MRDIAVEAGPREVAVGKDGTAYVTSQEAGVVSVMPPGAARVARTVQVSATPGTTDNPHGIAVGPDGSVYVADITGNAIAVIKPGGTAVACRVPVKNPKEVAVGADGTVYALAAAQNLSVIRPGGTEVALSVAVSASPGHLAVAPNGSVLITNPQEHTVSVLGPELLRPGAPAAAAQSTAPQSPAVGPSQQMQASGGDSSPWGSMPIVLGVSVLVVLAAAAAVIVTGRRRKRQLPALEASASFLEHLVPSQVSDSDIVGGSR
ncbi:hypothetical protein SPF06_21650 [Sinomonas sp. JGH33]|uniref:SMP-30/Gluconolactonase/LRE-like region domain-containing protein n=1 Tax=Sinomonas terricola TaxID=3110330 RepID=A0ABU5TCE5_9MICC|nr:hypothetical protein [Sinomonas sp. JGH33]MEA5457330.1 hypothetical protein [Sinomonas sp. JGH33]